MIEIPEYNSGTSADANSTKPEAGAAAVASATSSSQSSPMIDYQKMLAEVAAKFLKRTFSTLVKLKFGFLDSALGPRFILEF